MSQLAFRSPAATPTTADAVQRYVAIAFARFERSLCKVLPVLEEPSPSDTQRALRRLQYVVEALAGFAIGSVIASVGRALRRGFGPEAAALVSAELARCSRGGLEPVQVGMLVSLPKKFLADADAKPLLDELGARLHVRLCLSIPQTRACLQSLVAAIEKLAPEQRDEIVSQLDRLATDDTDELAFTTQLHLGWAHFGALTCGTREPDLAKAAPRIRNGWCEWSQRARGIRAERPIDPLEVVRDGYVMRIA